MRVDTRILLNRLFITLRRQTARSICRISAERSTIHGVRARSGVLPLARIQINIYDGGNDCPRDRFLFSPRIGEDYFRARAETRA